MLFEDDWDILIKSHLYSRKEFKNGVWRYYYDKHNNFAQMTQCQSSPLNISSNLSNKNIVKIGENYLKNIWIADWKAHPDKSICKELKGKKISFDSISYEHISKTGKNFIGKNKQRNKVNLLNHVKYLPCAKELLEDNGIHTQSRYERFGKIQKDGAIGIVYQTVSGLAPKGDVNNYVQVTVSQRKFNNGALSDIIYISVVGTKNIKKSLSNDRDFDNFSACRVADTKTVSTANSNIASLYNLVNKSVEIKIIDLTEGNKKAKFEQLEKCLNGGMPEYIPADDTPRLPMINIKLKDFSKERVEKALRTMSMSLGVPEKANKGELFFFRAQEDLTNKWYAYFAEVVRNTYNFTTDYFGLPKKTVMSKSENLTYKGKILYYPETGEPIKNADWEKFTKNLEKFLNRSVSNPAEKIILQSQALGKILDRMLKYNTLEAVKKIRLNKITYHGKSFDWISDSVKNMKNVLGESLARQEMARIETLQQSAAMKVTNVTSKVRGDIQQILIDGVRGKKSKGQVSQDLFDKMVGDNRDYQRLADTEIQNAFNNSVIREEVQNTPEGHKTYFQRVEVIDGNTCPFCRQMNGKIAVWSDKPLKDDKAHEKGVDFVLWEGKEWNGKEHGVTTGVFHPFCRGYWAPYDVGGVNIDAMVAELSKKSEKWNNAVKQAKNEFKEKGIKNPDDSTKGFTDRINELFHGENVKKSLTYSGHKLQGRTTFQGMNISIENKKGSIRCGTDSDGHKWAIKMHYDYGYIRGTEGADGDHVDCYLGDNENARNVYIIHQKIPGTDTYDEDKCMLGFNTLEEAKAAYLKQYDKPGFFGGIDTVAVEVFKEKVLLKKWHGKRLDL
ncbi:hypothetical protein [Treponema socranskii]|uniref:hypothetical protein n=1 Tax=Treponema socranskii TaxID=53419 RepID=UPI003D93EC0F